MMGKAVSSRVSFCSSLSLSLSLATHDRQNEAETARRLQFCGGGARAITLLLRRRLHIACGRGTGSVDGGNGGCGDCSRGRERVTPRELLREAEPDAPGLCRSRPQFWSVAFEASGRTSSSCGLTACLPTTVAGAERGDDAPAPPPLSPTHPATMSFFGRLMSHFFQDAAVNALANSKAFQRMAVKTIDAQKAMEALARDAAADPSKAKAAVAEGAHSFWTHLKSEIARDLSAGGGGAGGAAGGAGAKAAGTPKVPSPPRKLE